jgi:hypothetical protein
MPQRRRAEPSRCRRRETVKSLKSAPVARIGAIAVALLTLLMFALAAGAPVCFPV